MRDVNVFRIKKNPQRRNASAALKRQEQINSWSVVNPFRFYYKTPSLSKPTSEGRVPKKQQQRASCYPGQL